MIMIYFHENLKDFALELVNQKGNADDVKASNDLTEINNIIVAVQPTEQYIEMAKRLHKRIDSDYLEISKMCNLASTLKSNMNNNEEKRKSDIESIKDCLITDAFGILASVLIKHKKIETIKEFIKSVD